MLDEGEGQVVYYRHRTCGKASQMWLRSDDPSRL